MPTVATRRKLCAVRKRGRQPRMLGEQPTDIRRGIQTATLPANMSRYFLSSDKPPAPSHSSEPAVVGSPAAILPPGHSLNTQ